MPRVYVELAQIARNLLPNFGSLVELSALGICTVHHNGEEPYAVPTVQLHPRSDVFNQVGKDSLSEHHTRGHIGIARMQEIRVT